MKIRIDENFATAKFLWLIINFLNGTLYWVNCHYLTCNGTLNFSLNLQLLFLENNSYRIVCEHVQKAFISPPSGNSILWGLVLKLPNFECFRGPATGQENLTTCTVENTLNPSQHQLISKPSRPTRNNWKRSSEREGPLAWRTSEA